MSNVVIQVSGSSAGDGFLIAPDNGITFTVPLNLSTNDGSTVSAPVDATPNGAGVTLPGGSISIGPSGVTIPIFATAMRSTIPTARTSNQMNFILNPFSWKP